MHMQPAMEVEEVVYSNTADNSHDSHLGRLKGAHQSVIKPRKQVFSFSFIPLADL